MKRWLNYKWFFVRVLKDDTGKDIPMNFDHGTTTLGFKYQGGVLLAVDSRATGGMYIGSGSVKKIIEINRYLLGTMAGGAAEGTYWERFVTFGKQDLFLALILSTAVPPLRAQQQREDQRGGGQQAPVQHRLQLQGDGPQHGSHGRWLRQEGTWYEMISDSRLSVLTFVLITRTLLCRQ